MERVEYLVTGMSCGNCVKKVTAALVALDGVSAEVTLSPARATLAGYGLPDLQALNAYLAGIGTYRLARKDFFREAGAAFGRFLPLITMFTLVLLATLFFETYFGWSVHGAMLAFMGFYFLFFGALKALNWNRFAQAYRRYDSIAKDSELYALLYPAIELSLGALFLSGTGVLATSLFTMLLMTQKAYSVTRKLAEGGEVQCACLGGFFSIPVTHITLIEDIGMALMAAMMAGAYLDWSGVQGAAIHAGPHIH